MDLDLSKYQGVIFDMDGTLIDTMPAHLDAWAITAEEFDFPFDRKWIHGMGGKPSFAIAGEVAERYGIELDFSLVSSFKMATFAAIEDKGKVIQHTFQVLQSIFGQKKIAVGTGAQRPNALKLLADKGLTPYFETIVTSSDVENYKPEPDTFLSAASNLGVAPENCVVFEDTELGKRAAHAAGMDCYLVVGNRFEYHPVAL